MEIRSTFAVGHTETTDQVEVDMEYQKQMLALHLKANPREVLVGWYATSSELNTFSALIQNFYSGQGDGTWPHPAVHLTVSTEPGKDIETRAYISAPVGVTAERAADSAAFIPVPHEIRYGEAEKSGLEAIAAARDSEERSTSLFTDIEALERAIEEVLGMIDRVSRYVESVIDEEAPASTALGQFLLNALALAPKVEPADIERDLYEPHFPMILYQLTNHILVTTTSRTSWWFRTWQIPFVHRWSFLTGLQLLNSPLAASLVTQSKVVPSVISEAREAVVGNSATKSGVLRKVAHRMIRFHYEDTFAFLFRLFSGISFPSCNHSISIPCRYVPRVLRKVFYAASIPLPHHLLIMFVSYSLVGSSRAKEQRQGQ